MDYKFKYLKYKNKYLELKKTLVLQTGGNKNNKNKIIKKLLGGNNYNKTLEEIYKNFDINSTCPECTESLKTNVDSLQHILEDNNVSPCHGIEHAKKVMYHAWKALEDKRYTCTKDDKLSVLLAALLHDADDGKFFPDNKNNENLRLVLKMKNQDFVNNIVYMVNLVSSSKNGDSIPDEIGNDLWKLIPRYADRIEALGLIGIERCFTYTTKVERPLYIETTPMPTTEKDIWQFATEERYKAYSGNSVSMIDHYYDKLLRLSIFPIKNSYFDEECKNRIKPLIDFLIMFGKKKSINIEEIKKFIEEKKASISIEHD